MLSQQESWPNAFGGLTFANWIFVSFEAAKPSSFWSCCKDGYDFWNFSSPSIKMSGSPASPSFSKVLLTSVFWAKARGSWARLKRLTSIPAAFSFSSAPEKSIKVWSGLGPQTPDEQQRAGS